jgi:ribonuclease BN (tRNA processing enzyme)
VFGAAFGPGRDVPRPELWLPPGGDRRLRDYGGRMAFGGQIDDVFDVREYAERRPFEAAGFEVLPVRLEHYSEQTFGLRVSNRAGTVAYSGDTGPSPALAELARDADLFLCEATLREPERAERGHLSEDEALDAFTASGAKRLVVIHRPDELPLLSGTERAADGDVYDLEA